MPQRHVTMRPICYWESTSEKNKNEKLSVIKNYAAAKYKTNALIG